MIRSEGGMLRSYVQCNVRGRDVVGFVNEAKQTIAEAVTLPAGVYIEWGGQFEHQQRARRTLTLIFCFLPTVIVLDGTVSSNGSMMPTAIWPCNQRGG